MIPYYMIANIGTLCKSKMVYSYPYHLILAQLYAASAPYRTTVREMRARGTQIILDNGAHEGIDIDPDEYSSVVADLIGQRGPMTIVLPDLVGRSSHESRQRSLDFARRFGGLSTLKFMYVPQGRNKPEIIDEFRFAQKSLDPKQFVIGLGQSYLTWETDTIKDEQARYRLVTDLVNTLSGHPVPYHLLGARWRPYNWAWLQGFCGMKVVGMDTIKPLTCAFGIVDYPEKPRYQPQRTEGIFISAGKLDLFSERVADESVLLAQCCQVCRLNGLVYGGDIGVNISDMPGDLSFITAAMAIERKGNKISFTWST